jgi:hypothetical protein
MSFKKPQTQKCKPTTPNNKWAIFTYYGRTKEITKISKEANIKIASEPKTQ